MLIPIKTFLEEEREQEIEKRLREGPTRIDGLVDDEEKTDAFGRVKAGRFGHLWEVGIGGFVDVVEKEERGV